MSIGMWPSIVALTVISCLKVHSRWRLPQVQYGRIIIILHRGRRGKAHTQIPYVVIWYFLDLSWNAHINLGAIWFRVYFLQLPRCDTDVNFFNNSFACSLWLIWLNDLLVRFHCRGHWKLWSIERGHFSTVYLNRRYMADTPLIASTRLMHADLFFENLSLLLLPCYRSL